MNITRDTSVAFICLSNSRHRGVLLEGCSMPHIEILSGDSFELIVSPAHTQGFNVISVGEGVLRIDTYTEDLPPSSFWENL